MPGRGSPLERNGLHHFQVIAGQAGVFQRRAQVAQLADAQVLEDLRAGADF
ncbi:hypothetical protein D3C86_2182120 [compost metagenome]